MTSANVNYTLIDLCTELVFLFASRLYLNFLAEKFYRGTRDSFHWDIPYRNPSKRCHFEHRMWATRTNLARINHGVIGMLVPFRRLRVRPPRSFIPFRQRRIHSHTFATSHIHPVPILLSSRIAFEDAISRTQFRSEIGVTLTTVDTWRQASRFVHIMPQCRSR